MSQFLPKILTDKPLEWIFLLSARLGMYWLANEIKFLIKPYKDSGYLLLDTCLLFSFGDRHSVVKDILKRLGNTKYVKICIREALYSAICTNGMDRIVYSQYAI